MFFKKIFKSFKYKTNRLEGENLEALVWGAITENLRFGPSRVVYLKYESQNMFEDKRSENKNGQNSTPSIFLLLSSLTF
jgi:hypothetical protein